MLLYLITIFLQIHGHILTITILIKHLPVLIPLKPFLATTGLVEPLATIGSLSNSIHALILISLYKLLVCIGILLLSVGIALDAVLVLLLGLAISATIFCIDLAHFFVYSLQFMPIGVTGWDHTTSGGLKIWIFYFYILRCFQIIFD